MKPTPQEFKIILIKKEKTITQVAKKIGCSREWLSLVIHDHAKGKKTVKNFFKALDLDLPEAA